MIKIFKEKIGNGKFGLVKLGIHKETGEKVAIKILSKKDMSPKEMELAKTEIEILKICQHPNIVRVYDVFENLDYIYISINPYLISLTTFFKIKSWSTALVVISLYIFKSVNLNFQNM